MYIFGAMSIQVFYSLKKLGCLIFLLSCNNVLVCISNRHLQHQVQKHLVLGCVSLMRGRCFHVSQTQVCDTHSLGISVAVVNPEVTAIVLKYVFISLAASGLSWGMWDLWCSMQAQSPCGMWDLSSLNRDRTCIPCIERFLTAGPQGKSP